MIVENDTCGSGSEAARRGDRTDSALDVERSVAGILTRMFLQQDERGIAANPPAAFAAAKDPCIRLPSALLRQRDVTCFDRFEHDDAIVISNIDRAFPLLPAADDQPVMASAKLCEKLAARRHLIGAQANAEGGIGSEGDELRQIALRAIELRVIAEFAVENCNPGGARRCERQAGMAEADWCDRDD